MSAIKTSKIISMPLPKPVSLISLIVSTSVPFSVAAAVSEQESSSAMERIVVDNKNGADTLISTLNKQTLNDINAEHIEQVMVRISGSDIHRGSGVEYLPSLRSPVLTGAGACGSLLTLVDSVPIRAAGFCNINELFETPFNQASYIEVFKGPWSSVFGSNAQNGVINVITPEVLDDDMLEVRTSISSDELYRASFDGNSAKSNIRSQLSLTDDKGWRDDSGFEQQQFQLKHQHDAANTSYTTSISASHLAQQTAGYIVGKDAYKDDDIAESNPNPEAYRDAYSLRASMHIEQQMQNGDQLSITPYLRHADMEFLMHFLPGQPVEKNRQQSVGLKSQYHLRQTAALQWLFGIDSEFTQASLLQFQEQPTQGSEFLQETIPVGKQYDYEVDASYGGAFVRGVWQHTDKLSWQFGARIDYQHYDYDNLMISGRTDENGEPCGFGGCRYSRPQSREDSFNNPSYQLGAQYQIDNQSQLYVNAGHGFRAPQATELYRLQRDQQSADLDSEQTDSIELGYAMITPSINLKLAGYYSEKEDIIIRDSDAFNVNGAGSRHKGLELDLNWQITSWLRYFQHSSYSRHTYTHGNSDQFADIAGNDMDSAPKQLHTAGLAWQVNDQLSSQIQYRFVDQYYTDAENEHRYDGHQLFDLSGKYQFSPEFNLQLRVANLLDEQYAARADFSGFAGDRYFPGQQRRVYLDLRYQF
ncbi:TonB-dependent receptor [Thalassotalea sp. HSM 43]|nr:TonB-dependent receptor [Thalassotalea sp. HSM 43]